MMIAAFSAVLDGAKSSVLVDIVLDNELFETKKSFVQSYWRLLSNRNTDFQTWCASNQGSRCGNAHVNCKRGWMCVHKET